MDTYSVYYQSNADLGSIMECECRSVSFTEAMKWFQHHTTNVAARAGLTHRVFITDNGDCIIAEWRDGSLVWPEKE